MAKLFTGYMVTDETGGAFCLDENILYYAGSRNPVAVFSTRRRAKAAIRRSIKYAQEHELPWTHGYQIYGVRNV